ncbi:hypothetical protein BV22DRAFT_1108214 [Leucogyrophana mollusca]|uniref:Uncharacterized protein n=1 Tax=Leucogyrophana mollusca TaxID=85980 RepID=A0ACB8B1B7_9AGAM|nr:hypothetical protein BV22DRAFT_1108214 [Leucogyrophana mollusca]
MDAEQLLQLNDEYSNDKELQHHHIAALGVLVFVSTKESRLLCTERLRDHRTYLYEGGNDRAFITTMGLDVESFHCILNNTLPTAVPRASHCSLDPAGALGLVLQYLNSTMRKVSLMQIFALIPSMVSCYIWLLDILLCTLKKFPAASIQWPQGGKFQENNNLVVARHNLLTGALGTMDGLNLPVEVADDHKIKNATYNGWLHAHFVSSVLAFVAEGIVIACRLNAPGSWHDSRVAQPIYEKLHMETPEAPIKEGQRLPADPVEQWQLLAFDHQLLSFHQLAEWGVQGLQGSFGCLRVPLDINFCDKRGDLLEICVQLNNVRARLVGINEIRSEEIWARFEQMMFGEQRRKDCVGRFHHVC